MKERITSEAFLQYVKLLDMPQVPTEEQIFKELLIETFKIDCDSWKYLQGVCVPDEKGAEFFRQIKDFEKYMKIQISSFLPANEYFFVVRLPVPVQEIKIEGSLESILKKSV